MAVGKSGARLLGIALVVSILAGCAGRGSQQRALDSYTAEEIYKQGELQLETGAKPKDAIRYFQEVERLYPYSEWAKRSLIMQAFSQHKAKEYEDARSTAQRFLDTYPGDDDAPYAAYLMALSYYDQIDEVGRDQGLTFQALQGMRRVIEQYPDSDYARSAMLKFELAFDHLAGKEMEIGRYYLKRRNYTAAINRFRTVVQDFQTTTHTAEALHRLVEAYLGLGFNAEAQTAGAILGFNYQSSPFYNDSFRLLKGRGLAPEAQGDSWLRQVYRQMIKGEWL
ncbi:MAG: outer membrane protein assembly factor BamD [Pseudotabrizicola sp.]|uniref:outer membrane protein assembly factor BamD n=1 Tax=Pseudotabrizicola sp. TaxID=2939647 RepID=UPI002731560C|nr:outer membrane protein assembly factor BamD [Pseudotabrizicola sp.]MDP2082914.1 outer membrane protein assembly factor BamD [Pseudotabrizicola sp.]MDZ7574446.1 outer membrane protein assembly factor BamD [Pseudotabrizicola sp.]